MNQDPAGAGEKMMKKQEGEFLFGCTGGGVKRYMVGRPVLDLCTPLSLLCSSVSFVVGT